jgi:ubiquinone/menaquinone biosynthesis C-methylase UbiE
MKDYVKESQETWDKIAHSFDTTRGKTWDKCIDFINLLSKDAIVADIACGNGRHLIPCAKRCKKVIGLDVSIKLLEILQDKIKKENLDNVILIHSDAANLPIDDNSLDAVLFIAALHNIKGRENRVKSLKEIKRVLKPGGIGLISVWTKWRDEHKKSFVKKLTRKGLPEHGDKNIYWRQHGLNVARFYHMYNKKNLIKDIKEAGLKIVNFDEVRLHSKRHPDNYFVLVKN